MSKEAKKLYQKHLDDLLPKNYFEDKLWISERQMAGIIHEAILNSINEALQMMPQKEENTDFVILERVKIINL